MDIKVYQAINAVQADLAKIGIQKDSTNTYDGYKFRGIDAVYNALAPLLATNKLCILPRVLSREVTEKVGQKGTALFYVALDVEFDFVSAEDGSKHTVKVYGEAMDRGDKATNKAMSAAYKYACFQTFAIPTEGDNDADGTSHEVRVNDEVESRKRIIEVAADKAIALFKNGDEVAAYEEISGIIDNEEKLYLWGYLKPHSELRAAIKKLAAADKEKQS